MMTQNSDLYVGFTLNLVFSATDRVLKTPISDAVGTVDFFAPPKDPAHNPSDRTADHTYTAVFDSGQHSYVLDVSTAGWVPGRWTYRVTLTDSYTSWLYESFDLLA